MGIPPAAVVSNDSHSALMDNKCMPFNFGLLLKRVSEGVEFYLDLLASLNTNLPNGVCRVCYKI